MSPLPFPLLVERMGCIDRACVRRSTGCSCGSRIVDSEYGSLSFLGFNKILVPETLETVRRGGGGPDSYQTNFCCRLQYCGTGAISHSHIEYKQTTAPTSLPVTRPHQHNGVLHDVLLHRFPYFSRHGHCSLPLIHRSVPSSPNSMLSLTRLTPQARVKHSMSVAFSKKRVLLSGALSESVFVSA